MQGKQVIQVDSKEYNQRSVKCQKVTRAYNAGVFLAILMTPVFAEELPCATSRHVENNVGPSIKPLGLTCLKASGRYRGSRVLLSLLRLWHRS